MTKTYIVQNNTAKPVTLSGHEVTDINHVRATPLDQLIDDLLQLNYSLTKHQIFGDELSGWELLIAAEQGERTIQ